MENTLYLDSLHIKNEYKGKGIGTRVIEHLKNYAKANGYQNLRVSIMCDNDRARNLYTKLGAIHLNYYTNYETKCKKLYWRLKNRRYNNLLFF